MIAGHSLGVELVSQPRPDRCRIIGEISDDFGPNEFYRALVETRTISRQGTVGALARALHCWRMRCACRHLTRRVPVAVSRDI